MHGKPRHTRPNTVARLGASKGVMLVTTLQTRTLANFYMPIKLIFIYLFISVLWEYYAQRYLF